ncbi:hypothetical protein IscW_ISCW014318 [Ixodes scapularis]|uniref:Uncharacterized protein n=1 Tax=Ixodes scapularis TaxID=6945 RepID=B7QH97_IXOSC|nr:hypothetical protein IscW_ISCW014318 [Ixodes scapularis]|eukprot:XP_002414554.1 hypothetical protein IscW_ISCW014318 [Ixodes scapularis]
MAKKSATGDNDRFVVELLNARNLGESDAVVMRRLELEHARELLRFQTEERIAMRRIEAEGKTTRQETWSGTDGSEGCHTDPFSQCAKVLKVRKMPYGVDVPVWFEEVEDIFSTFRVPKSIGCI